MFKKFLINWYKERRFRLRREYAWRRIDLERAQFDPEAAYAMMDYEHNMRKVERKLKIVNRRLAKLEGV